MTRKIETIPVRPRAWGWSNPCRVLGRIRNLSVCWAPEVVDDQGELLKTYRARRRYCTIATLAPEGHYVPVSNLLLTQWQALRLAIQLAHEQIDWAAWMQGFENRKGPNDTFTFVFKMTQVAARMPDDQRRAENQRTLYLKWVATAANETARDTYYLDLLELENFMGA